METRRTARLKRGRQAGVISELPSRGMEFRLLEVIQRRSLMVLWIGGTSTLQGNGGPAWGHHTAVEVVDEIDGRYRTLATAWGVPSEDSRWALTGLCSWH